MRDYTINYKDGTTQTFTTNSPQVQGEWIVFQDGVGEQLRVRADEVESVIRDGTPERTSQAPKPA